MGMQPTPVALTDEARKRQNLWRFFSALCNREVELESFVEFIVWLSFEFNPEVELLCERPGSFSAFVLGKQRSYTPDLFVRMKAGEESLNECKKDEEVSENEEGEWRPKRWPVMQAICGHYQMPLHLRTDADYQDRATAVGNWREALPYVADEAQRPRHRLRDSVLQQFEHFPKMTLGELAAYLPDAEPSEVYSVALWQTRQGQLALDWNAAPLGRNTLLTLLNPSKETAP